MPKVTPTAKKLLLAREVAHLRERAGLSQTEAGAVIEKGQSRIAALEAGQANIAPGDLLLLLGAFGVTDQAHVDALMELRRGNHQRGKWTGVRSYYSEDFRTMVDLEEHSDLIRTVECEVPPGLLQCESFVRALYTPTGVDDVEERVQARVARQAILHREGGPQAAFVISESAVRRQYGPPELMREQVEHMLALSRLPNVRLQLLPFKARATRSSFIRDCFVLLRIPSPGVAGPLEMAYTENEAELRYLDDKDAVAKFDGAWARLAGAALSFEATRRFLRDVIADYS